MALLVKDGLAMRLTFLANRLTLAAATITVAASAGCQRLPYLDQAKPVPHQTLGTIADEDRAVKTANFPGTAPMPLPKLAAPRTTDNPEAEEIWQLTLPEALRIGLDNSEVIRVISLGAQGIPQGGFEPTPLNTGAGAGASAALGAGTLSTVYDPALQETQIATALANFDTTFTTSMLWGHSVTPFNNGISAGTISTQRFPIIFVQDTGQFASSLQKRTMTGAVLQITHNINYLYSNSPGNVFPSAYTTNTQLQFTQPLLGGTAQNPSGLEANRAPIVIARLNADAAVWNFKAAVMAEMRSIEQQYWALSQQQIQLWSRETAVRLGEEIVRRERAELEAGRGTTADVAEAQQNLENFQLAYITATSDVITTERQLRNILGLPPADNRRIIPVTAPTEARIEPDWQSSLAQMLAYQPDIVQQQLLVRLTELQLLVARNQLLPQLNLNALYQFNGLGAKLDQAEGVMTGQAIRAIDPLISARERAAGLNSNPGLYKNFQQWQVGLTFIAPIGFRAALANTRNAQYQLLRQRAFLQQIVHQQSHSLARFFLEVDANYKQFKTAQRLRQAAQIRLESARAYYEEGRTGFTIDRLLDAVSQYANAIAQEAQFKTSYNTSIAALEEAKGTLLAYDNIAVAEGPSPRKSYIQARDQQAGHRQLHIPPDGPQTPNPPGGPAVPDPVPTVVPPYAPTDGPKALFPAPSGPLGPPPSPVAPAAPAGERTPTTSAGQPRAPFDTQVAPAMSPAGKPAGVEEPTKEIPIDVSLPPLPPSKP
jgi:outer membrane protein TolC